MYLESMIWTFFALVIGLVCWYLFLKTRDLWGSRNRTPAIRTFHKQIHGITHRNGDGSSRQKIIADCYDGEELVLVPEPSNQYDPGAVKICRKNGDQLGYWPSDAQIADQVRNGWTFRVTIDEIYPFEENRKKHGVKMRVDVLTMAHGKVPRG